jgi:hypothetical protein
VGITKPSNRIPGLTITDRRPQRRFSAHGRTRLAVCSCVSVVVQPPNFNSDLTKVHSDEFPGADHDPIQNSNHVRDLYFKSDPEYSGRWVARSFVPEPNIHVGSVSARFTVPIVWDTKTSTIVRRLLHFLKLSNRIFVGQQRKLGNYPFS